MTLVERNPQSEPLNRGNEIRICVPVIGESVDEFIGNVKMTQQLSDLIELRTDYINGLKQEDIPLIRENIDQKSIFTCRIKTQGGKFKGSEQERIAIHNEALGLGFDYIDIELLTLKENQLDLSKRGKTKLIVSDHNFDKTPQESTIRKLIKEMKRYNPDIVKIATQVVSPNDNNRLFRLMLDEAIDIPRIIIGMGELGKLTRIFGPLLGSYLTFASAGNQATAKGQIEVGQLRKIYESMGYKLSSR